MSKIHFTESANSIYFCLQFGLASTDTKRDLLRKQADLENEISIKDKCMIGVGYNLCLDISFNAVVFFK